MRLVHPAKLVFVRHNVARCSGLIGCVLALIATINSHADIDITQEGDRVEVEIQDEPIATIMAELADRFDFVVEGAPAHWSDEPLSFSAAGDLEAVLNTILSDTSHVYGYQTKTVGGPAYIASVKLLNIGKPGPMFESQAPSPQQEITNATDAELPRGQLPRRSASNTQLTNAANNAANSANSGEAEDEEYQEPEADTNNEALATTRGSSLSQSLEQRARQTTGQAGTGSAVSSANADMQALTRKALQDVQGLADALRKADSGSN